MNKDAALKLIGLLSGSIANLNHLAYFMKENLDEKHFTAHVLKVGAAMAEVNELVNVICAEFPEITPKDLL